MQQQKQQPGGTKPKFSLKRISFSAGRVVFIVLLLGAIVTGILFVMTGQSVFGGLSALITSVATVLAVSPKPEPRIPVGNPALTSPNNPQSRNVTPNSDPTLVSVQLAQTASSPQPIFFFNMPLHDPNEFYGHTAARTTLIARTANGGSSSIVGERRAGKTWFLRYLQLLAPTHSKLGSAYRIAFISADHPRCKSLAGVVEWALEELGVVQSFHDPNLQPLDQLSRGIRTLKKQGTKPALCIDEFEGFNDRQEFNVDFVEGLRAMAQSDGLILVTASKRPLKELIEDLTGETSPLFNIVQQISLHPFTEQEAREFVGDKSDIAGFTKDESDFFLSQSTLHNMDGEQYWPPLRLQLVGQMLLDDKQARQGQPLDDELDKFHYRSDFETRLNESYQAVMRAGRTS